MVRSESLSVSLTRRANTAAGGDADCSVVWLHGEHDLSTKHAVAAMIASAGQLDDADVLVDLSGVTFMDASIVGTLIGARNRLIARARLLEVRAPSMRALHVLELCGLVGLVHDAAPSALHPTGPAAALGTWVDVPSQSTSEPVRTEVTVAANRGGR